MLNKLYKTTIVLLMSFFLTGCWWSKNNDIVIVEKEIVYVTVPSELLVKQTPPTLMDKTDYMTLRPFERELYLADLVIEAALKIKTCNMNIEAIERLNSTITKQGVTGEGK